MATATVHIAEVGGFAGVARCFAIDPPYEGYSHVTLAAVPGYGRLVRPKVDIFPADATGACVETSLMARGGSFTLHDEPDTTERIDGAYWLALQLLGGYDIVPVEPEVTE